MGGGFPFPDSWLIAASNLVGSLVARHGQRDHRCSCECHYPDNILGPVVDLVREQLARCERESAATAGFSLIFLVGVFLLGASVGGVVVLALRLSRARQLAPPGVSGRSPPPPPSPRGPAPQPLAAPAPVIRLDPRGGGTGEALAATPASLGRRRRRPQDGEQHP